MPIDEGAAGCRLQVLREPLGRADAEELARCFHALADRGRLRLLSFIAAQPGGEACVCHLTGPLGLAQPTVSHHLRVLTEAGLLARERRGTWAYYRLVPARIAALRDALALPAVTAGVTTRSRPRRASVR
ncbi:MAG TPA: metalloregulator ArsR/SmtB family transcription factor [Candidatus Binatia bacterium]|nr:metalloregulator ArsR/SmtB family transcription factor [Candidatus Binatia bacterium]